MKYAHADSSKLSCTLVPIIAFLSRIWNYINTHIEKSFDININSKVNNVVQIILPHKVPQSSALEEDFADLVFLTIPGTSLGAAGVRRILYLIWRPEQ